jgi:MFS family permease
MRPSSVFEKTPPYTVKTTAGSEASSTSVPSVWLMTKVPVGKYIGVCLVLWGITLCLMSVCHNFAGLATVRFFLGIFEAAVLPCMMLLNPMWYRKEEQPLRTAFWYNTFAGVFGGILSYAIGGIDGSLATWKV